VAGFILAHQELVVAFDLFLGKNEPMVGRVPGNPSAVMEFQEFGCVAEIAAFLVLALGLDGAELVERFLELAGEAGAVEAQAG
jgi:hypothetical protein